MAREEKPLPKPPRTPFGRGRAGGAEGGEPLTADRLAAAQAQGRLEEFLARELPDNPRARDLATMMLGMTGMAPAAAPPPPPAASQAVAAAAGDPAAEGVPPEVLAAVGRGDFGGLVEVLRREHARRSGDPVTPAGAAPEPVRDASAPTAAFDRETVEAMLQLAADNGVTPDWVVHRAIKLYVEEHRKTGRL